MDLRGKDLRGPALKDLLRAGHDLLGADLRKADLRDSDLRAVDLRGADLRGADLRGVQNLTLAELVDYRQGAWVPLAAWDGDTRFPSEVEAELTRLGIAETNGTSREAIRRGLATAARTPLLKN